MGSIRIPNIIHLYVCIDEVDHQSSLKIFTREQPDVVSAQGMSMMNLFISRYMYVHIIATDIGRYVYVMY